MKEICSGILTKQPYGNTLQFKSFLKNIFKIFFSVCKI